MIKLNMKVATGILLIVSTAFTNTECFSTFDKRQDNFSSADANCSETVARCAPIMSAQPYLTEESNNFGTLAPIIDQVCQELELAIPCVLPVVESCDDYDQILLYSAAVTMEFFCSDDGKLLLRDYQQSACYTNFQDPNAFLQQCHDEESYVTPADTNRSYSTRVLECVIRHFAAACGTVAGLILTALVDIQISNYISPM